MKFDGGYYKIPQDLIRAGINSHTAAHPEAISDTMLDALNAVQAVAWRINPFIYKTMKTLWQSNNQMGVVPDADYQPLPERLPDAQWEKMEPKERAAHKHELLVVHAHNARMVAKRESFLRKLQIAEEMLTEPAIYFPHFLDFRGRMYPMAQDLQPQGDDCAKGLLTFSEGKPLGPRGMYWLAVRLANTFGHDKLSFEERVNWVAEHDEDIVRCATDPLDNWLWTEADEPWQFLATCDEYARSQDEGFVSHLPIPLDGTCNGLQHLSLMGRDPVGAKATNCSQSPDRNDLYTEIADAVRELVAHDATRGNDAACAWLAAGITRATVKRAVMTTPYGVTDRGIRDQLIGDGFAREVDGVISQNADYLAQQIRKAMGKITVAATEIMAYFQDCAGALAEAGLPLRWRTPAGMEVWQSYWHLNTHRINTLMGRFRLWDEDAELGMSFRKQKLASAPNVVHSFDAAMLAHTALQLRAAGTRSFAFVHDSYATHACDSDRLAKTLRSVAVQMYLPDRLQEFHKGLLSYAPDVKLPEPPVLGEFDPMEVLGAPYFFA